MRDMTEEEFEEFAHNFELPQIALGTVITLCNGRLELTFNHPPTNWWQKLHNAEKRSWYYLYFSAIMCDLKRKGFCIEKANKYLEVGPTGRLHLHGFIDVSLNKAFSHWGIVSDCVRKWLAMMPKRYGKYSDNYMYDAFPRYCCPSICVSYHSFEEVERNVKWEEYIKKNVEIK